MTYAEKHLNPVKLSKDTLEVHINMRCDAKRVTECFMIKIVILEELNYTSGENT